MHLDVDNLSCQHCVRTVTSAIRTLDANAHVEVDLARGQVIAEGNLEPEKVIAVLFEEGYPARAVD
ncbi:MAG: heavy-metal-associated domain-containing protein [Rhodanobacteraceae bacterium]|nr:heavy-metal-associated domain-containing protein [Rhodanobacteraceae bacterium]